MNDTFYRSRARMAMLRFSHENCEGTLLDIARSITEIVFERSREDRCAATKALIVTIFMGVGGNPVRSEAECGEGVICSFTD